ncbi:hypothetical protein COOONC_00384 [Cooperia oncophora]
MVENNCCPYEAESPDELAIIMGAILCGFKLEDKSATHIIIGVPDGSQQRYEVLQVFPFHADRKRMSVVVKTPSGPLLYCKGADSAVLSRTTSSQVQFHSRQFFNSAISQLFRYIRI